MDTKVWGPPFWFVMQTVAFTYPQNPTYSDKRRVYEFYTSLANWLPCTECNKHYAKTLKEFPIAPFLDSNKSLFHWVVQVHNRVNKRLGKAVYSVDQVWRYYQEIASAKEWNSRFLKSEVPAPSTSPAPSSKYTWKITLAVVAVLAALMYVYLYRT